MAGWETMAGKRQGAQGEQAPMLRARGKWRPRYFAAEGSAGARASGTPAAAPATALPEMGEITPTMQRRAAKQLLLGAKALGPHRLPRPGPRGR